MFFMVSRVEETMWVIYHIWLDINRQRSHGLMYRRDHVSYKPYLTRYKPKWSRDLPYRRDHVSYTSSLARYKTKLSRGLTCRRDHCSYTPYLTRFEPILVSCSHVQKRPWHLLFMHHIWLYINRKWSHGLTYGRDHVSKTSYVTRYKPWLV